MSEATKKEASTIHRLLEVQPASIENEYQKALTETTENFTAINQKYVIDAKNFIKNYFGNSDVGDKPFIDCYCFGNITNQCICGQMCHEKV